MANGPLPREQKLIDDIFAKRLARAETQQSSLNKMRELKSIVVDLEKFRNEGSLMERAGMMKHQPDVEEALKEARAEDQRELQMTSEIDQLRDRRSRATSSPD
jgi:hypothetical protein